MTVTRTWACELLGNTARAWKNKEHWMEIMNSNWNTDVATETLTLIPVTLAYEFVNTVDNAPNGENVLTKNKVDCAKNRTSDV